MRATQVAVSIQGNAQPAMSGQGIIKNINYYNWIRVKRHNVRVMCRAAD